MRADAVVEKPALFPPPVSIVVPTFREAAGLRVLVERVQGALSGYGAAWELLLVDDDSGDGSEDVVAALASGAPVRLHVRREPPGDLSRSVLLGIRLARFDRVVVMDADLSHPPERIPALLGVLHLILIDDVELDMAAFGRLLRTYAGFGMRIAFVDEDDAVEGPASVVKEPDDRQVPGASTASARA